MQVILSFIPPHQLMKYVQFSNRKLLTHPQTIFDVCHGQILQILWQSKWIIVTNHYIDSLILTVGENSGSISTVVSASSSCWIWSSSMVNTSAGSMFPTKRLVKLPVLPSLLVLSRAAEHERRGALHKERSPWNTSDKVYLCYSQVRQGIVTTCITRITDTHAYDHTYISLCCSALSASSSLPNSRCSIHDVEMRACRRSSLTLMPPTWPCFTWAKKLTNSRKLLPLLLLYAR